MRGRAGRGKYQKLWHFQLKCRYLLGVSGREVSEAGGEDELFADGYFHEELAAEPGQLPSQDTSWRVLSM